jgi:antirestriction protein ArdC
MPARSSSPNWAPLSFAQTSNSPRKSATDHASYIATWLTVLKNDNRTIFQAAAHAQRAVDYLHKLQPEPKEAAA